MRQRKTPDLRVHACDDLAFWREVKTAGSQAKLPGPLLPTSTAGQWQRGSAAVDKFTRRPLQCLDLRPISSYPER